MKKSSIAKTSALLLLAAIGLAAQPLAPPARGPRGRGPGGPAARALQAGPGGTWWREPAIVQRIGLTPDQQKKIEDAFQQSRLQLIDLTATLDKEEAIMEPLLAADRPDETKILGQIDRIAQARAELEKANARMLLGFRNVLSQDQWAKLKAEQPPPAPAGARARPGTFGPGPGGPGQPPPAPGR